MKKVISVLMVLVMALTLMNVAAFAASDVELSVTVKQYDGYTLVNVSRSSGSKVYYTTDGTKPTSESKKYTTRLRITEPCTLKLVSYVNGEAAKYLTQKVKVQLKKPSATLKKKGEEYTYYISGPEGASIYMTLDGSKPSKKNGTLITGGTVTIPAKSKAKFVCVKKGWLNSAVFTLRVGAAPSSYYTTFEDEVVRLINEQRVANGLNELTTRYDLSAVAQTRAQELTQSYSHTRPDGTNCFTALTQAGIYYYNSGENIASGCSSPEDVVKAWMSSPGHRANILSPKFNMVGVGFCDNYWAQVFIS